MAKERAPILLADHSDAKDPEDVMSPYCNDLEGGSSDSDTNMQSKGSRKCFRASMCIVGAMALACVVMAFFTDEIHEERVSDVPLAEDVSRVPCIHSLQFSPHAECFEHSFDPSGSCANFVGKKVNDILNSSDYDVDFASIIYSNGNYRPLPWNQVRGDWGMIHGQCPVGGYAGPGVNFTEDDIILLYDKEWWTMLDGNASGCLGREFMPGREHRDDMRRPYVIRAFQNKGTLIKVLVVAAHFPHPQEYEENVWKLRKDIKKLVNTTGIENVILLADTNFGGEMKSPQIFKDIGVTDATNRHGTQSTSLFSSCCYPAFKAYGYDRVISNLGHSWKIIFRSARGTCCGRAGETCTFQ